MFLKTPACVGPHQTSAATHPGENTPRPHTQFDTSQYCIAADGAKEGEIGVSPKTNAGARCGYREKSFGH
ncbi:MAG: hypothetical protein KDF55_10475, partial [Thauera sp.]|nr:hypothetical protein [Thauera sp.]